MSNIPKVSVMVPVYNKEVFLSDCLESILAQTLTDIEIICVDDASTDRSAEIIASYREKDSRIRVVSHPENKGIIQARKSAFNEAKGEFIAFADADDLMRPEMCECLYDHALTSGSDFVQCNAEVIDDEKILTQDQYSRRNRRLKKGKEVVLEKADVFKGYNSPIRENLWLSLYKKDLFKKVASFIRDTAPRRGDDNLLTFFACYFAQRFSCVSDVLYSYRANTSSSNIGYITGDIVKSQIVGRAEALGYAKWFVKENNLEWRNELPPFSSFTIGLLRSSASFIYRFAENNDQAEVRKLLYLFGDSFKGDGLLFLMDESKDRSGKIVNVMELAGELDAVYSSMSWKITEPLRRLLSLLR